MALRPCKECGQQISSDAKTCPHCGKKVPSSTAAIGCLIVIGLFVLLPVIGRLGSPSGSTGPPSATPTDSRDVLLQSVQLEYSWSKSGFGNVMVADFTVKNPTQYRFKDFEIRCDHAGPSGTHIDSNTRTMYEVVQPKSTKKMKGVNMGFIHSQAATSSCRITDLVVVP